MDQITGITQEMWDILVKIYNLEKGKKSAELLWV